MRPAVRAVLAVDLGGTKMRAASVAPDGRLINRCELPTPRAASCPDALDSLMSEVGGSSDVDHAVVGLPGRIGYEEGRLEWAPNLPESWLPDLTADRLASVVGMDVSLANDADLAAVGEAYFGAGRGFRDVAFVTISTGVGAGVVLGGRVVRGRRSLAELGHTVIDYRAADEGDAATVERLGSGSALARMAARSGVTARGAELARLAERGDRRAKAVWDDAIGAAAYGIANLCHMFLPQAVVVGGGVGRNGSLVLDHVRATLREYGPKDLSEPIEVIEAALGDDAGLVGAVAWHRALRGGVDIHEVVASG